MRLSGDPRSLVLVDGRSGAGKSEWAKGHQANTGFTLLSLDDFYPGWDGLDAGHWRVLRQGIEPWARREEAMLPLWDWKAMAPGGFVQVDPTRGLIIEGCGAVSRFTVAYATDTYWVEADRAERKRRALERDGEMFAPHWERWALQEDRFYGLHRSMELAQHLVVT
jgi:uridine kinase